MKKILITGGSGFIGTNLIEFYINYGYNILNIDIVQPKNKNHFKFWNKIDLNDYNSLKNIIIEFKPDYVIHLAAITDLKGKNSNYYNANIYCTKNLIDILNEFTNVKRVIYTSTMLVCNTGDYTYNHRIYSPSTFYGKSKAQMEELILNINHTYEWAIIRPTSIWGPYFGEPYYNFFKMIINNRLFLFDCNNGNKTFGYVENTIFQIDSILNESKDKINKKIFYLGDYQNTNIFEWSFEIARESHTHIRMIPYFIIKIAAIFGDFLKVFSIDFPISSFRLKNMTSNNIIDLTPISEIASILPYTRIDGLRKTLNWFNTF
jgi:nucleoside-diphosphate-sugar epimerase